jgi:hypothetical protein
MAVWFHFSFAAEFSSVGVVANTDVHPLLAQIGWRQFDSTFFLTSVFFAPIFGWKFLFLSFVQVRKNTDSLNFLIRARRNKNWGVSPATI